MASLDAAATANVPTGIVHKLELNRPDIAWRAVIRWDVESVTRRNPRAILLRPKIVNNLKIKWFKNWTI